MVSIKCQNTTLLTLIPGYDKYGRKIYQHYGNNTQNEYIYDNVMPRLKYLKSWDSNGYLMQDLSYTYDLVGNISSIENRAPSPVPFMLSGSTCINKTKNNETDCDKSTGTTSKNRTG